MAGHSAETRAKISAAARTRSFTHICECGAVVESSTPNLKRCAECRAEHERARLAEKSRRQCERGYVSPSHAPKARREQRRRQGVISRRRFNAERQITTAARGTKSRVWFMVDSAGEAWRYHGNMAMSCKRAWSDPDLRERMSQHQLARNPKRGPDDRGFTKHQRRLIYARDENVCQLCGGPVNPEHLWPQDGWLAATADHIVARANGGKREVANGQTAHMLCNWLKSDKEDHEPPPWEVIQRQATEELQTRRLIHERAA